MWLFQLLINNVYILFIWTWRCKNEKKNYFDNFIQKYVLIPFSYPTYFLLFNHTSDKNYTLILNFLLPYFLIVSLCPNKCVFTIFLTILTLYIFIIFFIFMISFIYFLFIMRSLVSSYRVPIMIILSTRPHLLHVTSLFFFL